MSADWFAATLDEAFIRAAIRPTLPAVSSASRLARLRRAEEQTQAELPDDCLFPAPDVPRVSSMHSKVSRSELRRVVCNWPAAVIPLELDWGMGSHESRFVRTVWYTTRPARPLLVVLAGWIPILGLATRALWPLGQLDRAGFDVVIPWLTNKAANGRRLVWSDFPGADPCGNVLEVARRVAALRQTIARARALGHDTILIWGVSLGAYVAALLATIAPAEFEGLVLEKPLARLSDPLRLHGRGSDADRQDVALRLDRVYRAVSPLERQPQVDSSQVHVIGACYDRVTTFESAERLAAHFGSSLEAVRASHLLDPKRARRFERSLSRFMEPRRATRD